MREGIFQTSHDCAHPEISHAIPRASIIVMVRKPHDSNDRISKVKTVERELHAKLGRGREISSGSLASCRD
jgi:hypothetical protein